MRADKYIILCATQRSGSAMIFDDLISVIGHNKRADAELLYTKIIRGRTREPWSDVWPCIRSENTFNGVVVNKVMFHYVAHLSDFIAGNPVERPRPIREFSPTKFSHFYEVFQDSVWVYIDRLDIFAQTVSMYLAESTNIWEKLSEPSSEQSTPNNAVRYDQATLENYLYNFYRERRGWHEFFDYYRISPVHVTYEDAAINFPHYLDEVIARVDVPLQAHYPSRRMLKLGDEFSRSMISRFRDDVIAKCLSMGYTSA